MRHSWETNHEVLQITTVVSIGIQKEKHCLLLPLLIFLEVGPERLAAWLIAEDIHSSFEEKSRVQREPLF